MDIRFSAIGLTHNHVFKLTQLLVEAGATLVSAFADEPSQFTQYKSQFPQVKQASSPDTILEDDSIQLIIGVPLPNQRANLGIRAMLHGKDYLSDKPGFTTLKQLEEARRVQAETGKKHLVYFSERLANPATIRAAELVHEGAIGQLVHMTGLGPHIMNPTTRPDWFFQRDNFGGILVDLACHQIDQFLYFSQASSAEIVTSQVGNFSHPQYPHIDDFGDLMIRNNSASAYARVDYFTPDGLGTWGDVRTFLMGTDGTIEIRKNIDIKGRSGDNHLFLVNQTEQKYIDCSNVPMLFGEQLVKDIADRTETAIGQEHCFTVSELSLQAELNATRIAK
jgi:predicted dehydrogenase